MTLSIYAKTAKKERRMLKNLNKILLDIDQKIILLDHQNNFVGILKNNEQRCKQF